MRQPGGRSLKPGKHSFHFNSASAKCATVLDELWTPYGLLGIAAVAAVVVLVFLKRLLRGTGSASTTGQPDLRVDLTSIGDRGPDQGAARLEFYNTPVRLGVLVVAPLGRGHALPSNAELAQILNNLVPNLLSVINSHKPVLRRWPAQLSAKGFSHAFFTNVALPGDRGKGSPWCAIAGKFMADGDPFLVGLACCASQTNGLGHVVVEHEGQWLDVLRIRTDSDH